MSSVLEHLSLEWTSGSHLIHLVKAEPGLMSLLLIMTSSCFSIHIFYLSSNTVTRENTMSLWKFPSSYFEILSKTGHDFYPQKKRFEFEKHIIKPTWNIWYITSYPYIDTSKQESRLIICSCNIHVSYSLNKNCIVRLNLDWMKKVFLSTWSFCFSLKIDCQILTLLAISNFYKSSYKCLIYIVRVPNILSNTKCTSAKNLHWLLVSDIVKPSEKVTMPS